jgi:lipoprotein-releasing system permease protein
MGLSWFIAKRLGKKESKSGGKRLSGISNIIAIVSVAVSIITIIVSVAVSGGFRKELMDNAIGFTGDLTVIPPGIESSSANSAELYSILPMPCMKKVAALPFIKCVQGTTYRPGLIKTDDQIQGVVLKGTDSSYDWSFFKSSLLKGTLPNKDSNEVMISKRLADMLLLKAGDKMTMYFIGDAIQVRRFKISGIYSAQLEDFDKLYVLTDSKLVRELNGWTKGEVSSYEILFKNHDEKLLQQRKDIVIKTIYDNLKNGDNAVSVTSVKDNMFTLFDWLHLLDLNVLIILVLMIAVAGFNMVSGILIILFENISHIGLFKAMGMKDRNIARIFLAKTSMIVLKGLIWGTLIGAGLCWAQWKYKFISLNPDNYFVKFVPIHLTVSTVLITDAICFAAIMLILLIPCRFISKVSPARTLTVK